MKHIYNLSSAATTLQSSTSALGTALSGKIFTLLLLSFFLLVSGKSMGQANNDMVISSITPSCLIAGQTVELTIIGSGFHDPNGNPILIMIDNESDFIKPSSVLPNSITVTIPGNRIKVGIMEIRLRRPRGANNFDLSNAVNVLGVKIVTEAGQNCNNGSVKLSVSGENLNNYYWYNQPSGGTLLGTGNIYNTDYLTQTTTFYVSGITSSGCETRRVPVQAIIGSINPTVTNGYSCTAGPVEMRATGAPAGSWYNWYDANNNLVDTNSGVYSPNVDSNQTDIYYVSISSDDCESEKTKVTATVGTLRAPTVTSNLDCNARGQEEIIFYGQGAGPDETYEWYKGSMYLGRGATLSRQTNRDGGLHTVIIVKTSGTNCPGTPFDFVVPSNNTITPSAPSDYSISRCLGGSVVLAPPVELGMTYRWYDQNGGLLGDGLTYTIPSLSGSTTFTFSKVNIATRCESTSRATATVTATGPIQATGEIVRPVDPVIGQPATFSFTSNIPDAEVVSYQWYYHTVGSPSDSWVPAANTRDWTIGEMRGDIDAVRVVMTLNTQNATCYNNLNFDNTTYEINDMSITPLPVELISFNARRDTRGVMLTWATASELDNKGFEVQVSTNNRQFTALGFVESKVGTTLARQDYSFLDTKAVSGTRYYRLKQIDFDGTTAFSPVRAVVLNDGNNHVSAYPNPFDDVVVVTLNGTEARNVQVMLMDAMGKVIQQRTEETSGNSISVDMRSITTKGIYVLHVYDNDTRHTFKLMKR